MKTTVIYHRADFDGIFCREIARKFLPEAELIGWDFADAPLDPGLYPGKKYILDLPVDRVFGMTFPPGKGPDEASGFENIVWIDHHASSIASHPKNIPGYRIDGVAACRLAWQWFNGNYGPDGKLPTKEEYIARKVSEPLAVRLAGEYDIWDKRDERAEIFQFGLRSRELNETIWELLLVPFAEHDGKKDAGTIMVEAFLEAGEGIQFYQREADKHMVNGRSFMVEFEGLKFLVLNTARCNSLTFAAKDLPETGHDALMGFYRGPNGKWNVSLYHARHRTDLDLSVIAVKYGGGGHRGACGFALPGVDGIHQL